MVVQKVFQKLAEALAARKGPRHMISQQVNKSSFPTAAGSARLAGKTSSSADGRESLEDRIRCRAFLLAENAGFPPRKRARRTA
jgi:hypothetical protein